MTKVANLGCLCDCKVSVSTDCTGFSFRNLYSG